MNKYTVVRDTREKEGQGWVFSPNERCAGTVIKKLDVGDYALEGYESLFVIERKGSVSEFCANLNQERFVGDFDKFKFAKKQSEINRLQVIQYPYLLLEFTVEDLLKYPNIPEIPKFLRKKIRFKGYAALKKVIELEMNYKTRIIFCGDSGKEVASSICKRMIEEIESKLKT